MTHARFRERYGPWGLVAGAAEGLGAAWARGLARRGLSVVLADRKPLAARTVASDLRRDHGVGTRVVDVELSAPDAAERIARATHGCEVGLLVYDAAHAHIGPWSRQPLDDELRMIDVNVRGLVGLADAFVRPMVERGRGGLLVVSSNAGLVGHALTATYGATKAFGVVWAEALWHELRPHGVDVLACCPAAVATPGFEASGSRLPRRFVLAPDVVAEAGLAALGRGPVVTVGGGSRMTAGLLRVLPRSLVVGLLGRAMRALYPGQR